MMKKIIQLGLFVFICACIQSVSASLTFINEIHYDNIGGDSGEGVEIAGLAGTDLSGWSVALYNGANGAVYGTQLLGGVIQNQSAGYGVLSFNIPGLQNGSPDGLALLDAAEVVIQFLSYEGQFTALSGAASGMTSVDIGLFESSSARLGTSLQLTGLGNSYNDFSWSVGDAATFGSINNGQIFQSQINAAVTAVPEPGVLMLMLIGFISAKAARRLRSVGKITV